MANNTICASSSSADDFYSATFAHFGQKLYNCREYHNDDNDALKDRRPINKLFILDAIRCRPELNGMQGVPGR